MLHAQPSVTIYKQDFHLESVVLCDPAGAVKVIIPEQNYRAHAVARSRKLLFNAGREIDLFVKGANRQPDEERIITQTVHYL